MEHLYVIEGRNGLLKVGCTSNFERRLSQLKPLFQGFSDDPVRHRVYAKMPNAHVAESILLAKLRDMGAQPVAGREWFRELHFEAVSALAESATQEGAAYRHPARVRGASKAYTEVCVQRSIDRLGGVEKHAEWLKSRRVRRAHTAVLSISGFRSFDAIVAVCIEDRAADKPATTPTDQQQTGG